MSTHRILPHFRLTVIPTGRLAAYDPNVLAIPKHSDWGRRIRKAIIVPKGFLFGSWDYSQLEMRVMAHVSQDKRLLQAYCQGIDIHAQTAQRIFGVKPADQDDSLHRLPAKSTGFLILMGGTGRGLYEVLTKAESDRKRDAEKKGEAYTPIVWQEDECYRFIAAWLDTYPGVRDFQRARHKEVEEYGTVRDFYGRRFLLPQVWCANRKLRDHALRQAQALPIQSGAQVIVKRAEAVVPSILTRFPGSVYPLLQVHDDLDFEVRRRVLVPWDRALRHLMETTTTLSIPLVVEGKAGRSWGELEKIPL